MKHRGVSEIVGGILMLGLVATIAALVLTLGLSSIVDFGTFLIDVDVSESQLKESLVIEHVQFKINTKNVVLRINNIGLNAITIDAVSIVNFSTQESIVHQKPHLDEDDAAVIIQARTRDKITVVTPGCDSLDFEVGDSCIGNRSNQINYVITVTTGRGNIFEVMTIPLRV